MYIECQQCGRYAYAKRSTKKFCSNSCRQKNKRGTAFESYYASFSDPQEQRVTTFLEMIADSDPVLFGMLQRMRDKYGRDAMIASINAMQRMVGNQSQ